VAATMKKSPAEIIEEKGANVFAEKTGKTLGAIRVWKHRNHFPRECWPEINRAFPDLTLDCLMTIEASFPKRVRETA
jgi:hypothetical protein